MRLLFLLTRPAVVLLLTLFAAIGLARASHGQDTWALARTLVVVVAFLLFSVACNDLADESIDRVNLPGDARRPLVAGTANRREMVLVACGGAVVALAASCTLRWPGIVVTAAGLGCSAVYSLRPVRLADRGALAPLVLPACYVAVPYLLGIVAVRPSVRPDDLVLLAGLYVGFIGRILLKDFRDVRGDALFGKRTFLVRYGRRWTCRFSAAFCTVGTILLVVAVPRPSPAFIGASAVYLALSLAALRALSAQASHRRDEALIAALAICGRGLIVSVLAHLSMNSAGWGAAPGAAVLLAVLGVTAWQAVLMARRGPTTRLTVPAAMSAKSTVDERATVPGGSNR
jgi:4-hydroxybenzoate polyprenyltransferase